VVTPSFLRPLLKGGSTRLAIVNSRNQQQLADDLIPAFDSKTRRTGLLRHDRFPAGSAMLIAPSNAVHTFFMRFSIDVAFVTREGRVVKTYAALAPWRIAAALRGYAVIELPAGTLSQSDTVAGDTLTIVPSEQV
jgi:uncharacterized membrane protein (UPF0127 family)